MEKTFVLLWLRFNGFWATPNEKGGTMGKQADVTNGGNEKKFDHVRKTNYAKLFRKFIFLTVVCSLVPLLLVGWGINIHYTRFAKSRMVDHFKTQVDHHQKIIELFLQERSSRLKLIAHTHHRDALLGSSLKQIFQKINEESWSFTDLGVIDARGNHLAYVGPYDLIDKNYSNAFWFHEVLEKGIYISDMFMGFRNEPHFIIAVTGIQGNEKWILRATIDTEVFRSLVENVKTGNSGEVFLLNRSGVYQTTPRFSGQIMQVSAYPIEEIHKGTQIKIIEETTVRANEQLPKRIIAQAWLNEPPWMLVVKQDYSEALNEVNYANHMTLFFLHISALIILIVTLFITRYMITTIKRRDAEASQLNKQLMQAGKLASIGELSAGVAHEINNPLAIILTEKQILLDLQNQTDMDSSAFKEQLFDSMNQIDLQIKRCKRITHNLLRFARRTKSILETVNLNEFIGELIELMEREAKSNGIKITHEFNENLPALFSDPSQLQQVFLNLITNAIDAHENKPYGNIHIKTDVNDTKKGATVSISDTGSGVSTEHLEKIFDPFFTTKPVGKGTGLGLSICYSIIKQLGGDITVSSKSGMGTEFILFLPDKPPQELLESMPG
jgi:two-component system NtrC family sensor kinase